MCAKPCNEALMVEKNIGKTVRGPGNRQAKAMMNENKRLRQR